MKRVREKNNTNQVTLHYKFGIVLNMKAVITLYIFSVYWLYAKKYISIR